MLRAGSAHQEVDFHGLRCGQAAALSSPGDRATDEEREGVAEPEFIELQSD